MAAEEIYKTSSGLKYNAGKLVIIMVGLPARNKSFIAQSLLRYLTWIGVSSKVFNLAEYRRRHIKFGDENEGDLHFSSWYYDSGNSIKKKIINRKY